MENPPQGKACKSTWL